VTKPSFSPVAVGAQHRQPCTCPAKGVIGLRSGSDLLGLFMHMRRASDWGRHILTFTATCPALRVQTTSTLISWYIHMYAMMSQFFVLRQIRCVRPAHVVWRMRSLRLARSVLRTKPSRHSAAARGTSSLWKRWIETCWIAPGRSQNCLHILDMVSLSRLVHRDNTNLCTLGLKSRAALKGRRRWEGANYQSIHNRCNRRRRQKAGRGG
jgi:hypothetical protein